MDTKEDKMKVKQTNIGWTFASLQDTIDDVGVWCSLQSRKACDESKCCLFDDSIDHYRECRAVHYTEIVEEIEEVTNDTNR